MDQHGRHSRQRKSTLHVCSRCINSCVNVGAHYCRSYLPEMSLVHGQLVPLTPLLASTAAAANCEVACAVHEQCQANLQNRRLADFAAKVTPHIVQCNVM